MERSGQGKRLLVKRFIFAIIFRLFGRVNVNREIEFDFAAYYWK